MTKEFEINWCDWVKLGNFTETNNNYTSPTLLSGTNKREAHETPNAAMLKMAAHAVLRITNNHDTFDRFSVI